MYDFSVDALCENVMQFVLGKGHINPRLELNMYVVNFQ